MSDRLEIEAAQSDLDALRSAHRLRKTKPATAELERSALAWLTLAQSQAHGLEAWVEHPEGKEVLAEMRRKLEFVRAALTEVESAK